MTTPAFCLNMVYSSPSIYFCGILVFLCKVDFYGKHIDGSSLLTTVKSVLMCVFMLFTLKVVIDIVGLVSTVYLSLFHNICYISSLLFLFSTISGFEHLYNTIRSAPLMYQL